uniref:hypothetical protein n=1 Tax=Escherichia coli TaxID=562 RepID=UPI0019665F08
TDNSVTLTGEAAIRRMVAKALLNNTTSNTVVYDPTPVGGVPAQYGESVARVTAGAIADSLAAAEAAITVTRVSKT